MSHPMDATGSRGPRDPRGALCWASRSSVECRRSSQEGAPHAREGPWRERMETARCRSGDEHIGGCMSNTHGRLPKAERAQLPAELQQRLEAWTTKAYTDDNLFLTLARSPGVLEMFLHWAAFMYTGISRLDPSTMELCRIRLAARNHCVH